MIVVVGESLVDIVGGVEVMGGSPMNVAVGLARLDVPTILVTEIGDDERGARLVDHIVGNGVELVGPPPGTGRTSTATAVLDPAGVATYEFDLCWTLAHQELPPADALHIGSLGTVLEPGRDAVLELQADARDRDVFVSYDPNVRPALGLEGYAAWPAVRAVAAGCNLVKLSDEDAEHLRPGVPLDDLAAQLLTGERTELVVVTRGGAGSTAYVVGTRTDEPVPAMQIVDTVGAGDAFMAALLTVLFERGAMSPHSGDAMPTSGEQLSRLLSAASLVAARTCARRGAHPPSREELPTGWPD